MQRVRGKHLQVVLFALALAIIFPAATLAMSSSGNYQVVETKFGSDSATESCSGQYCSRAFIGDISGNQEGQTLKSTASFTNIEKEENPLLEVIVDNGKSDLGYLSKQKPATKTMVVRVQNHLNDGYMVKILGEPPVHENHTLKTPSKPTKSTPGKEQFGINVVENAEPSVGADPIIKPSGDSNLEAVQPGYNTPDLFQYQSDALLARSTVQGRTDYTISMIFNISDATPPGRYSADFSAMVIPAF